MKEFPGDGNNQILTDTLIDPEPNKNMWIGYAGWPSVPSIGTHCVEYWYCHGMMKITEVLVEFLQHYIAMNPDDYDVINQSQTEIF